MVINPDTETASRQASLWQAAELLRKRKSSTARRLADRLWTIRAITTGIKQPKNRLIIINRGMIAMGNKRKIKTIDQPTIICPYCGFNHDYLSIPRGKILCTHCTIQFEVERTVSITYSTYKIED